MNIHNFSTLRVSGGAGSGGGALGYVPDWSKKVDVSAGYVCPSNGYLFYLVAPYNIFAVNNIYIAGLGSTDTANQRGMLGRSGSWLAFKGDTVSSVGSRTVFVPFSTRFIRKLSDNSQSLSFGSFTAPSDGFLFAHAIASLGDCTVEGFGFLAGAVYTSGNVPCRSIDYSSVCVSKGASIVLSGSNNVVSGQPTAMAYFTPFK